MSKTFRGATAYRDGRIEAMIDRTSIGATEPKKHDTWEKDAKGDAVRAAAKALIACADDLSPDDPKVAEVQVYSELSDPAGSEHSEPGEIVDVRFNGGKSQRAGETAPVPADLAAKRDAFIAAIMAAV